jgi:hypothetical protein
MSIVDHVYEVISGVAELEGWSVVERDGRPNFELRYEGDVWTGDVYYTLHRNYRFMNVRVRDWNLIEYYPTATESEIASFGRPTEDWNVSDYEPYVSKTPDGGVTHLYGVRRDPVGSILDEADQIIERYSRDGQIRRYTFCSTIRRYDNPWDSVIERTMPNWLVFYYDRPDGYSAYLAGYNCLNQSYIQRRRLIEHDDDDIYIRVPPG